MKLNLIMTSDNQRLLRITKSNSSGFLDIPYTIDNYAPLARYLERAIPDAWSTELQELNQKERDIINQRKFLMNKYKIQATILLSPLVLQFKQDHPELFI